MSTPSLKRQRLLVEDAPTVRLLYNAACDRFGKDKVDADHTRLWDLRCMWGISGRIPFGAMVSTSLSELLWVAEQVCGYVQTPRTPKAKRP
jgi:hypothetical protein